LNVRLEGLRKDRRIYNPSARRREPQAGAGQANGPALLTFRWTISDCQPEVGIQAGLDTGSAEATVRGFRVKSNFSEGVLCTQKSRDTLPVGGGQIGSMPFGIIP